MKEGILCMVGLLALLVSAPQLARAVPQTATSQDQPAHQAPTPDEVVGMLDRKLSLSDDQKAKITPIIADRQQRLRALAENQSTRRFQKAREMKSVFEESDNKIKAVLNDQQKKEYSQIEQQMREQAKQHRQERADHSSR